MDAVSSSTSLGIRSTWGGKDDAFRGGVANAKDRTRLNHLSSSVNLGRVVRHGVPMRENRDRRGVYVQKKEGRRLRASSETMDGAEGGEWGRFVDTFGRGVGVESETEAVEEVGEVFEEDEEENVVEVDEKAWDVEAKQVAEEFKRAFLSDLIDEEVAPEEPVSRGKRKGRRKSQQMEAPSSGIPDELLPKVAIVGRPNVGKSALFNRIAGKNLAIVYDEPGVTRDRLYTRAFWSGAEFLLVDTGGMLAMPATSASATSAPGRGRGRRGSAEDSVAITARGGEGVMDRALKEASAAGLPALIETQAGLAVDEADAVILVVDGQAGPTAADVDIASWLRRRHAGKTLLLAVNKCESPSKGLLQAAEFWTLGMTPIAISAISGTGTGDLLDELSASLPDPKTKEEADEREDENARLGIAIVGRPNVGKSSILNAMVGEQRTIVSSMSGTTRDAIDTEFTGPDGQEYTLIDTAGIRRRAAVASVKKSKAEALSVNRAFKAIRRADVVALVIDAMDCVTEQDFRLGERIAAEGKACVIVVNKWDLVPEKKTETTTLYEADVRERLRCLDWAPIVYTSANSGQRIPKILDVARKTGQERAKRLTTATLNQVVGEAIAFRPPQAGKGGKRGRIYYCTQAGIRPPTFVFFVNDATLFGELYKRYMEKQIRENIGFPGTPIRLLWRSKKKKERVFNGQIKKGEGRNNSSNNSSHLKDKQSRVGSNPEQEAFVGVRGLGV